MTEIKDLFQAAQIQGLSESEVDHRQKIEGFNELPSTAHKSFLHIVIEVGKEPMFLLLVACGILYLLLGEKREAALLLFFVFAVMSITIYQERKTERALEALRDLSSPRALVMREGEQKRIPGREVVRGDVIVVSEGDRVPADARLIAGVNLSVDESMLTGESVPVRKKPWDGHLETGRPGGDDLPFLYSGSLVVKGQGVAEVTGIGINTEMGTIGKALQSVKEEDTLLQKETGRIVKNFSILGLIFCSVLVVVYGMLRGNWLEAILAGIALAMATLPEEFPVVLTIFLALGAWRISQKGVLTRRVPAVETLGAASVLCVDKTGTLTQNKMSIGKLCVVGECWGPEQDDDPFPETYHALLEYAMLASQKDPFDPMEKAILRSGEKLLEGTEHLHANWALVREYPLSPELLAMSNVWHSPDRLSWEIAAKGAPEAIVDLCHMDENAKAQVEKWVEKMADEGLRVLGVAKAQFQKEKLPDIQHDFYFEFVGLVGLLDPVREDVAASIQSCYSAGIRTIMITGDYPGTAKNIARTIGLRNPDAVIIGPELENMTDQVLKEKIRSVNIFARVVPEQKLRIVEALKSNGEVTAMTGDGVNDAPALKSAHIGIAMGGRGTDVARESAALVLVDDDFSSIVKAVRMGRRIFDNIRKALAFVVAVHVPIAGLSLIPVFFKEWPLVLFPVHIVFLELIIDPACSVVFEAEQEEENIMDRKPRNPLKPLFDRATVTLAVLQGLGVLALALGVLIACVFAGFSPEKTRTITFAVLVLSNLGLIMTNRSWTQGTLTIFKIPNKAFWLVVAGASLMLISTMSIPIFRQIFHFSSLDFMDGVITFLLPLLSLMWFKLIKLFLKSRLS
ncbi:MULTISPECIES: cation-translocating P-type ATPase [Aminobacterium]|jgi:Ca2+-transporting ATPase|uniref:cation-translocating P-type ATPase n=1 Tax=Aminobacterium TaxID=81466 RepID=UPI00257967CC|nr:MULTISPECIES: cation-translocating P-type ATPase [unclassified Aminobacterium]